MNKCAACRKFTVIEFKCSCNKVFCSKHISYENHNCSKASEIRQELVNKHTAVLINSGIKSTTLVDRI